MNNRRRVELLKKRLESPESFTDAEAVELGKLQAELEAKHAKMMQPRIDALEKLLGRLRQDDELNGAANANAAER